MPSKRLPHSTGTKTTYSLIGYHGMDDTGYFQWKSHFIILMAIHFMNNFIYTVL
jgi:hypothetical protein